MTNLVKQISPSEITFFSRFSATTREYLIEDQFYPFDKYVDYGTSTSISMPNDKLNDQILFEINKLKSFLQLPQNWDSYHALQIGRAHV